MKNKKNLNQRLIKRPQSIIFILIISITTVIAFSKTSKYDFVDIDDYRLILTNPLITDASISYSECFTRFIFGVHYKPLVFLSWKAEYNFLGSSPSHFHTINWILHLLNSILVFFILPKLFERIYDNRKKIFISSLFVTILFCINPLRIESVAWVTERKDVLFSFFFLMGWLVYLFYLKKENYLLIILSAILYLMSGLSKSMGLTFIFIPFLMDLWFKRKINLKSFLEKIPYFLIFLGLLFLYGLFRTNITETITQNAGVSNPDYVIHKISTLEYINKLPFFLQWGITTCVRYILWIIHILVPIKLSIIYSHDSIFQFLGYSIFIFPFIIFFLILYSWKKRKQFPELNGGLIFFTITMAPALLYTISGRATFFSDRYTYIASIGIFFILIVWINKLNLNKTLLHLILISISLFYFFQTINNIKNWKNTETLFTQALKISPNSSMAYEALGNYYREKDLLDKALTAYNESIKLNTGNPQVYNSRGVIWGKLKKWDNALIDFNSALKLDPNFTDALSNRSNVYFNMKQFDKLITDLEKYLEIKPNDYQILVKIGLAYYQMQNYNLAIERLNEATKIDDSNGLAYLYKSYSYLALGDKINALTDANKAIKLGTEVKSDYIKSLTK